MGGDGALGRSGETVGASGGTLEPVAHRDRIAGGRCENLSSHRASGVRPRPASFHAGDVPAGAGGGTAAEILTEAGLTVIMIEGGSLKSSKDFDMEERHAYPNLYQQAAAMKTADKGIGIFQGRTVGGSTTINWTTSIRTPKPTLDFWAAERSVINTSAEEMLPWFEKMEQRLNIKEWQYDPNRNNGVLREGCEKLGWEHTVIKRNVTGCWNTGYCGMGCPVNAKQSMLVTTIPAALNKGATLISRAKVTRLEHKGDKVKGLTAQALTEGLKPSGVALTFSAKHYILSAGAIHTRRAGRSYRATGYCYGFGRRHNRAAAGAGADHPRP